jgi:hypothetical protein
VRNLVRIFPLTDSREPMVRATLLIEMMRGQPLPTLFARR